MFINKTGAQGTTYVKNTRHGGDVETEESSADAGKRTHNILEIGVGND